MKRAVISILVFCILAGTKAQVLAEERPEPSGDAVAIDLILMRPLGLVSVVVGAGVFIITIPFTVPTGSVGIAAKKLMVEPFKFTFVRPVGEDMQGY